MDYLISEAIYFATDSTAGSSGSYGSWTPISSPRNRRHSMYSVSSNISLRLNPASRSQMDRDLEILSTLKVPQSKNELDRLLVLRQCSLLDSNADERFDRYTSFGARFFKVPIALVSLVDVDRQWFKSRIGLDATQTHRDAAFCTYAILEETPRVLVVLNALKDTRFRENCLVLGPPFIRFYAGASIIVDGMKIGTLCIIDTKPRIEFTTQDQEILVDMANIVAALIEERRNEAIQREQDSALMTESILRMVQKPIRSLMEKSNVARQALSSMNTSYVDKVHSKIDDSDEKRNASLSSEALSEFQRIVFEFQSELAMLQELIDSSLKIISRVCSKEAMNNSYHTPYMLPLYQKEWVLNLNTVLSKYFLRHDNCRPCLPLCSIDGIQERQARIFTHPDVLQLALISLIHDLSSNFQLQSLLMTYEPDHSIHFPHINASPENFEEGTWFSGNLVVYIQYCQSRESASAPSDAEEVRTSFSMRAATVVAHILSWVSGTLEVRTDHNNTALSPLTTTTEAEIRTEMTNSSVQNEAETTFTNDIPQSKLLSPSFMDKDHPLIHRVRITMPCAVLETQQAENEVRESLPTITKEISSEVTCQQQNNISFLDLCSMLAAKTWRKINMVISQDAAAKIKPFGSFSAVSYP